MSALKTFSWAHRVFLLFFAVGLAAAQNSDLATQKSSPAAPSSTLVAQKSNPAVQSLNGIQSSGPSSAKTQVAFNEFVDSFIGQEHRLTERMRGFNPIIETYIQEAGSQPRFQAGITPNGDNYFLSRLSLSKGSLSLVPFADEETWKRTEEFFVQELPPFNQLAFAQALFPDVDHFDRQNYNFQFVRWELLGDVRCAVVDVTPRGRAKTRGFVGRLWVEDQDHNIVRFTGTFTKGFAKRAFHFDSWRLNVEGDYWLPANVYTEESIRPYISPQEESTHPKKKPEDTPAESHSQHTIWFKAQTRVWGYSPARPEVSQVPSPPGDSEDPTEDEVIERAQLAGLLAPDGDINRILQIVLNNLLVTNDLEVSGIRCRVLLTAPLESFTIGRTIVVSRGLLDVLPDEATLAAVLSHELAHVLLGHEVDEQYLTSIASVPDSQVFGALPFRFSRTQEKDAGKKALQLFSKSPYKDQLANVSRFFQALDANATRFPNLLGGRFGDEFSNGNLVWTQAASDDPKAGKARLDRAALSLGSRVVIDPWSDRLEMLKSKPIRLAPTEKMPFEVTPFYVYLKRMDGPEKMQNEARQSQ